MITDYAEDFKNLSSLLIKYHNENIDKMMLSEHEALCEGYELTGLIARGESDCLAEDTMELRRICANILKRNIRVGLIFTADHLKEFKLLCYKLFDLSDSEIYELYRTESYKYLSISLFIYCVEHYSDINNRDKLKVADAAEKCLSICNEYNAHHYYLIRDACNHILEENLPTGEFFTIEDLNRFKILVADLFPER